MGRAAKIGEIRTWADGKQYIKTESDWVRYHGKDIKVERPSKEKRDLSNSTILECDDGMRYRISKVGTSSIVELI